jgi:hypothetical protein
VLRPVGLLNVISSLGNLGVHIAYFLSQHAGPWLTRKPGMTTRRYETMTLRTARMTCRRTLGGSG